MTSTVWMGAQTLDSQDSSNHNSNNNSNNNSNHKETTSPGSFGSLVWSLVSRWMTLGRHSSPHDYDYDHDDTCTCTCTCSQTHNTNLSLALLQPINAAITHLSEARSHSQAISADLEAFHAGLVRHSICTPAEIHLALAYARRLQLRRSSCGTSEEAASVSLGPAAWVALVLLACKQLQDEPYDNSAFARLADMSLTSLNRLERALLLALDYRLSAQSDELLCLACALAPL